jgi:uncharacterized repeat protein (TIGR02543 family)/prepilin-type N-terminal cleavage/methylation domain-containing protein
MTMKKKNGFTLVEILAVIVILALLMIIAIPSVLDAMNKAKKENFYLYAQSLNSKATDKYIQQSDSDPDIASCAVYDISSDLDISSTGDYEGWVKVERTAVNSGKSTVSIDFTSSTTIQGVKYCVLKGSKCTPNTSYLVSEGSNKVTVKQTISEGQVMCANYDYPVGSTLSTSETVCKTYSEGTMQVDSYEYSVEVTLTDGAYVIQNYKIQDSSTSDKTSFYSLLDKNKKTPPSGDTSNPVKISSPTCSASDTVTYKGVTNTKTTLVTTTTTTALTCSSDTSNISNEYYIKFNTYTDTKLSDVKSCATCKITDYLPTPTRSGYTFDGWYYDSEFKNPVGGVYVSSVTSTRKYDSGGCYSGYNDVTLYAKWTSNGTTTTTVGTTVVDPYSTTTRDTTEVTSTTTSERESTEVTTTTTTRDSTDYSLLLSSLVVSGYDIGFDPIKYNYRLNVPNSVTSLSISYVANSPDEVTVSVIGNDNLNVGTNNVNVEVYNNYTGKSKMYTIYVKRFDINETYEASAGPIDSESGNTTGLPDPSTNESNAQLSSLIVSGYILGFDPDVYEYDLEIADEESLAVTYRTAGENAVVVVTGNENITDGSVIEVYVQSANGYYNKTYKINLIRNIPESNTTKILKYTAVGLGVTLAGLLAMTAFNKRGSSRIIRKKVTNNQNNNNNTNA